jgi:hypothetical protein
MQAQLDTVQRLMPGSLQPLSVPERLQDGDGDDLKQIKNEMEMHASTFPEKGPCNHAAASGIAGRQQAVM